MIGSRFATIASASRTYLGDRFAPFDSPIYATIATLTPAASAALRASVPLLSSRPRSPSRTCCRMSHGCKRESTIDRPFRSHPRIWSSAATGQCGQGRKATTKPRASHGRRWRLVLQPLIGAVTAVANLIRLVHRIGLLESLTDKQCRTPSANCAGPSAGVRTPSFTDEALRVAKTDWDADVPSAQPQ